MKLTRFLLGVDNPEFRKVLEGILRAGNHLVDSLPSSDFMPEANISNAMLVIDTDDDLPKLKRVVNQIYDAHSVGNRLPIHAIVSSEYSALDVNFLAGWACKGAVPLLSIQDRVENTGYVLLRDIENLEMIEA